MASVSQKTKELVKMLEETGKTDIRILVQY